MAQTLFDPRDERSSCGVGFVASVRGERTRRILDVALEAASNLVHRGALSADGKSGDGAGVLAQVPLALFARETAHVGRARLRDGDLGVGVCFLPPARADEARALVEGALGAFELAPLDWRAVPVDPAALGADAAASAPRIEHVLVVRPDDVAPDEFERLLYLARKAAGHHAAEQGVDLYVPSFSARRVVYKGLMIATQLGAFYADLRDPAFQTALAIFHQRYSTNTHASWKLAHPFRLLAHNGEINTIRGNLAWMHARESEIRGSAWGPEWRLLAPICPPGASDSAALDAALELLVLSGRSVLHAMTMLIPEAWHGRTDMDPARRAFYEYHACLMEPWDGPAAVAFSDGTIVGATLDRNGLRPARYVVTDDGTVVMGSEAGLVSIADASIARKGRLGPGRMLAIDTAAGRLLDDDAIKDDLARRRPHASWIAERMVRIDPERLGAAPTPPAPEGDDLARLQRAFGWTAEDATMALRPMAESGVDPIFSMGDDAPLAVLSSRRRPICGYLKQLFAQVTNPPIDPLREKSVMALASGIWVRRSLLEEGAEHARMLKLPGPVLGDADVAGLAALPHGDFDVETLPALFDAAGGPDALEPAIERLRDAALAAAHAGVPILVLSHRGVSREMAPIPMLLAVGAVHHHLVRRGVRTRTNLLCEAGDAIDAHHLACLVGYGAAAVCPFVALAAARAFGEGAPARVRRALEAGLLKVMSKMGISTVSSYRGAQVFQIVGLARAVVETCFEGTPAAFGRTGFREIARDALAAHAEAFSADAPALRPSGLHSYRRDGERHAWNPPVVKALQKAVRDDSPDDYARFAALVNEREPIAVRDLLEFAAGAPVPLDEVEPAEEIRRRFTTSGMSLGALSREAHETLARGMNAIGAASGSGEGGEDPARYGGPARSRVKQVASGRFGVTAAYLADADEIEIKMAQGSKPGEGGELPGRKVSGEIAAIRRSQPGVTLISPAPHHDIYSIEDLAQLVHDLKQVNPRARVSVKLVAEAGVGTVACGVAKAYADAILVSGHDGGTGASPLSSIKNAGAPWEMGLAEVQQALVANGLRGRVRLRVDGGLKTGRDVVIAAMLGAEEFTFGTAALVAAGCVLTRQCHLDTCPVGIATQSPELRARFPGRPENVARYATFVAREVRGILARIGVRRLDDVVGRADLLVERGDAPPAIDVAPLIARARGGAVRFAGARNDRPGGEPLSDRILALARRALDDGRNVRIVDAPIRNTDRSVGASLAGEVARRRGDAGLAPGTIELSFIGSAGQSFGAFLVEGIRLALAGEANDFVGKGMAGGEIAIRPPPACRFAAHENVIAGNTCLYGATGGRAFVAGIAGERFAVRNSGAVAVVEGLGDHGCEYMTGGVVVVLGACGRNFGAGMTGGEAYVYDEGGRFESRANGDFVTLARVSDADAARVRALVEAHQAATASRRAGALLARWPEAAACFWKVAPSPAAQRPAAAHATGDYPAISATATR